MAFIWFDPKISSDRLICGVELRRKVDDVEVVDTCKNTPVRGSDFCRHHGGVKQVPGVPTPLMEHVRRSMGQTKDTQKYSTVLRRDLLANYFAAKEIEDPHSQLEEIALLDARIFNLLSQLSAADGVAFYEKIEEIRFRLESLLASQDSDGNPIALNQKYIEREITSLYLGIDDLLKEARDERKRWNEVYEVVELKRRVTESDRKRVMDSQKTLTENQAMVLVSLLLNIINRNVEDPDKRTIIATELAQFADWRAS